MMTKKELMQLIAEGEGFYLEFKRDLNSDIKKEMVAFANASGGKILIGVEDNGKIKGINIDNNFRSQIQQHATECDPPIDIEMKDFDNIMVVTVHEGKHKPYRSTNGFYLRVGPNSQKMATDKIAEYVERYGRIRFDERVIRSVRFEGSIDQKLVNRFIEMAQIKNVFQDKTHILSSLGVVKEFDGVKYFTNAGILFFTNTPTSIIKQAQITCVAYNGTEKIDILDRKDFKEDIITSIESGISFIRRHLNEASKIKGLKREDKLEIPLVALREALVNAVVHRDYLEVGANVTVEIYSDRVVISNPGGLPQGLSAKDFGKYSLSRNPLIADLLLRVGLIEKLGTGVSRIKSLLKEAQLPEAEFHFNDFFSVTFWRENNSVKVNLSKELKKSFEKNSKQRQLGKQSNVIQERFKEIANKGLSNKLQEGLKSVTQGGAKTEIKSGAKGGAKTEIKSGAKSSAILTKKQKEILELIKANPSISYREVAEHLGINDSAAQKHFENLKKKGMIKRIGAAKGGHWETT